jgi:hypothetical protein
VLDVAALEERGYDFDAGARSSAVELRTFNPGVVGSNPTGPSTDFPYETITLTAYELRDSVRLTATLTATRLGGYLRDHPCNEMGTNGGPYSITIAVPSSSLIEAGSPSNGCPLTYARNS